MLKHEDVCSAPAPPHPKVELYHKSSQVSVACRQRFPPYWHHTFIPELEPENRAATFTQVTLYEPAKSHTHIFLYVSGRALDLLWSLDRVQLPNQSLSGFFLQRKIIKHDAVRSALPTPRTKTEVYHNPSQDFVACRQSFTPYWHHTVVPWTWAWK